MSSSTKTSCISRTTAVLALPFILAGCGIEESDLVGNYDCTGCPTKEVAELHADHRLVWSVNVGAKTCTYEGDWLYMTLADLPIVMFQGLEPGDVDCTVSSETLECMVKWHSVEKPMLGRAVIHPSDRSRIRFVQR